MLLILCPDAQIIRSHSTLAGGNVKYSQPYVSSEFVQSVGFQWFYPQPHGSSTHACLDCYTIRIGMESASQISGVCAPSLSLSLPLYLPPSLPLSFSFSHTLPANSTCLSHPKLQFLHIWFPYFLLSPINCLQAVGWGNCQVHLFIFFSEVIGIFITKWLKIVGSYILSSYLIIYGGV